MLSLTHSPINELIWHNHKYELDLAFDTVLLFIQLQQDKELDDIDKWEQSLELFFGKQKLPNDPDFYAKAFKMIDKIISDNPYGPQNKEDIEELQKESTDTPKPYDYVRDAGAIYASFFAQYHIDLNKERGKMHWTVFKALLDGLSKDTYLKRIIEIRQENPDNYKDPSDKQALLDAQNYYAVDGYKNDAERSKQAMSSNALSSVFSSLFDSATGGDK